MSKPADMLVHHTIVIPAKAGIHSATISGADEWVPAFAGMTNYFWCSPATLLQEGRQQ